MVSSGHSRTFARRNGVEESPSLLELAQERCEVESVLQQKGKGVLQTHDHVVACTQNAMSQASKSPSGCEGKGAYRVASRP